MVAMQDATAHSLTKFSDPSLWVVRPGVPVFAEHDQFDKAKLETIAANCNRREQTTGDVCPIAIGHTVAGAPETAQPEIVGYARNFRVGNFGPDRKLGVLADFYFMQAKYATAMTYPRRSVELWPEEQFFDPISLLRRTPKLDLGLLTYKKNDGSHSTRLRFAMEDAFGSVQRYMGEPPADGMMPMPPTDGSGGELGAEEAAQAERFMCHYMRSHKLMRHLAGKYGMDAGLDPALLAGLTPMMGQPGQPPPAGAAPVQPGMAPAMPQPVPPNQQHAACAPGPGNTYLIGGKTMSEQHAREGDAIQMRKELDATKADYQKLTTNYEKLATDFEAEKRLGAEERKGRLESEKRLFQRDRETALKDMQHEGWQFDLAEELVFTESMQADQFVKHLERAKKLYKRERAPVQNGMVVAAVRPHAPDDPDRPLNEDESRRARDLALAKGIDYQKARMELFPSLNRNGIPITR